jgi:uncharacterized membrane protein
VTAWAFRVKGGLNAHWSEVGVSRHNSGRVSLRVGEPNGVMNHAVLLRPDQARLLRRYLTQAIRETEAFQASAERGREQAGASDIMAVRS